MNRPRVASGALAALTRAGVIAPVRPDRLVRMVSAYCRFGPGLATLGAVAAIRHPHRTALIDERGAITFGGLDQRCATLADALCTRTGLRSGQRLGLVCRNHRYFVEASLAGDRLGADLVFLNPDFSGPQLADVLAREKVDVVVVDQEFATALDMAACGRPLVLAWTDDPGDPRGIEVLGRPAAVAPPRFGRRSRMILMTSGTTGTPKGAHRQMSLLASAPSAATLVDRMSLRAGEPIVIATPLFHGAGLGYLGIALMLASPVVLHRRFDAEAVITAIARYRAASVFVVPVMLRRMLRVPAVARARLDLSTLRAVGCSGAALGGDLAAAFMDSFGPVLFNLYGTTEVGLGAVAVPADLRAAPGTVGRAALGVEVSVLDPEGGRSPRGEMGRVFVGGRLRFASYSDGECPLMSGELMSTGDLGHLNADGLLFIDGRTDDMIVSGGENVFPEEIEELLADHPAIADAAVVAVPDADFGHRLAAYVVPQAGTGLSGDDVRHYVRANLARYKVPREVHFVGDLPRTATGKIARHLLVRRDDA